MSTVVVYFKGGTQHRFDDRKPGGSYTNDVRAEGEFLVVTDVWGKEFWYPASDVERVEKESRR